MKQFIGLMSQKGNVLDQEVLQLAMYEFWLTKIFPVAVVTFWNINTPQKREKVFKKKGKINKLLDNNTNVLQLNMLDKYIDHQNEHFKNGRYRQIYQLCLAELLCISYVFLKTAQIAKNDCQPVVLNDELLELTHPESRFSDKIELMTHNNKKLKCQKIRAALRYQLPNPQQNIKQCPHHLLLTFYPSIS